jgi:hypothetical protein
VPAPATFLVMGGFSLTALLAASLAFHRAEFRFAENI